MAQTAAVYEELIGRLVAWREPRSEHRALDAVGSHAQKEANVDGWSDLDVLTVTTKSERGIRSKVRVLKERKTIEREPVLPWCALRDAFESPVAAKKFYLNRNSSDGENCSRIDALKCVDRDG